jgi:spore maturation protein SpmA
MLNIIWLGLILVSVLLGGFTGRIDAVGAGAIDSAKNGVILAGNLLAVMTLWLGMMRLATDAGLVHKLGRALRPALSWLFPEIPKGHPALGAITMNFTANLLGLDNAATPLGLRAMEELQSLNPTPGVATNAMCMLLAMNTSNLTLIPTTVIAVLISVHAPNPTAIIAPTLLATAIAHAAAIGAAKLLENSPAYRLKAALAAVPPEPGRPSAPPPGPRSPEAAAGLLFERAETAEDKLRPMIRGGRLALLGAGLVFLAMLAVVAFPELVGRPVDAAESARFGLWRLLDGLSKLAIPWLVLIFPLYAALRRVPVYETFVEGAREGFGVAVRIIPYIVGMFVAIGMLRASGGMDMIGALLKPAAHLVSIPPEILPMALIRPFSSAAALGVLGDIARHYPPDSLPVLIAATLYGCSETTFYVIAVYFGAVNIRKTRHAIPAGIVADVVCPLAAVIVCNAMFA